jgi:hypothetical protein
MESMNPALQLLMTVKRSLERGQSVKIGIQEYLRISQDSFTREVSKWFSLWQQGLPTEEIIQRQISAYRRVLLMTLERGLRGEPIYSYLIGLEEELIKACEMSISQSLGKLPFVLLVPLLLFQLPAFLALLFGPLLNQFFQVMGAK